MLAVDGWAEIMHSGFASDAVTLSYDQSAIWIEADGKPVSVLIWNYQDYRREIWISLSYTDPAYRQRGYFRRMYAYLHEIAIGKKAIRIAGGVRENNTAMRAAAESCGRTAEYIVYAQPVNLPKGSA